MTKTSKTALKRRELVTLAQTADTDKSRIGGWLVSEKLDGTRCFWDGGLTRGMRTIDVPWAGILHPKTLELKDKIKPIATGLWSRYGNPIMAPEWFLDSLPNLMLDGELWAGRGNFQLCRSIVSGDTPDDRWDQIKYMVYGAPSLETITTPGLMKSPTYYCEIREDALQNLINNVVRDGQSVGWADAESRFSEVLTDLSSMLEVCDVAEVHLQRFLPVDERAAWEMATALGKEVVAKGGEGVIIRNPDAAYEIKRTKNLLKLKPTQTADAILVGFTAGRGKYEGMIGALILDYEGKRLELSGMIDAERVLLTDLHAIPGKDLRSGTLAQHFRVGDVIEFEYRELSDASVPKEARFLRVKGTVDDLA